MLLLYLFVGEFIEIIFFRNYLKNGNDNENFPFSEENDNRELKSIFLEMSRIVKGGEKSCQARTFLLYFFLNFFLILHIIKELVNMVYKLI